MNLNFTRLNKLSSIIFALTAISMPALAGTASVIEASLNGFYITLGPNIQNTKVDKTITVGDSVKGWLQQNGHQQADGTYDWAGGLQPTNNPPTITQVDGPSESKTDVLPQLTLGYMYPVWRQISLGVEGFYAPKTGSSNIASTTYGASGLLAYNFTTQTQAYVKLSYVAMRINLTGSQQFYISNTPYFGPAGSGAFFTPGNPSYTDPTFKIDQNVQGIGVALGARQLLPFKILGSRHLFAGGEISYTKYASKTVASPDYQSADFGGGTPLDGSITNTKISAKQYGANLYIGYRF